MKQGQQTCLLTGYPYCIQSFEKSGPIKVKWCLRTGGRWKYRGPYITQQLLGDRRCGSAFLALFPVYCAIHWWQQCIYFFFSLNQGIYLSSIRFKSSLISAPKLPLVLHALLSASQVTSADLCCRTQEKLLVWFLNLISLVSYVDRTPILISWDFNNHCLSFSLSRFLVTHFKTISF